MRPTYVRLSIEHYSPDRWTWTLLAANLSAPFDSVEGIDRYKHKRDARRAGSRFAARHNFEVIRSKP